MGNVQPGDATFVSNVAVTLSQLINQLNTLLVTGPQSGPVSQFVNNLNSRLVALRADIITLQNNEASTVNLASVNNSINNLNALMQTAQADIVALQNQVVDAMTLQDIQTTLTNLSNDIIALQSSVSNVNVVNLNALVNSLNSQFTTLSGTVNSKADKSTSINGKQLSTNITLTKSDLGLSMVTNDQQLKRSANDFRSFPLRTIVSANDVVLFEDSEVGGSKYCAAVSALPTSNIVATSLAAKADRLSLTPTTVGGANKAVTLTTNADGQLTAATDTLINITPAQANLGNVTNVDTTNIANSFIRNTFVPINSIVAVNDSGLNAFQKLQGQINARLVAMVGATTIANGVTGLVPAPLINQNTSFLRGDGTWAANTMSVATVSAAVNPAATNTIYLANTTGGAFNITLPSPTVSGVKIVVVDSNNNFNTNSVSLVPQVGGTINGLSTPLPLKNKITSVYFTLPNLWTVEQQHVATQTFSADVPVIVAPNPSLSNSSYTTIASLPTVMTSAYSSYNIHLNTTYSSINPSAAYVMTLSLTIIDDTTSAVVYQVPTSFSVPVLAGTSVYSIPLDYRFFTTVGNNYRLRVDAKITGGTPVSLTDADYDFNFTYTLVGQ